MALFFFVVGEIMNLTSFRLHLASEVRNSRLLPGAAARRLNIERPVEDGYL